MSDAETLRQAHTLRDQGSLRAAARLYAMLLDHPELGLQAHVGMGAVNAAGGFPDRAEPHLLRAYTDPGLKPEVLVHLGQVEELRGNTAGADENYRHCLRITPPSSRWHSIAEQRLAALRRSGSPTTRASVPPTRPALPGPSVRPVYRNGLVGTVRQVESRRENYLGQINALTVLTLTLALADGGNGSVHLSGTRILGGAPRRDDVVELDLDRCRHRGPGNSFETKVLFNHSTSSELRTETNAAGLTGGARRVYWAFGAVVIAFMVLVFAAVGFGIFKFLNFESPLQETKQTVTVPQVAGMNMSEAAAALEQAGFTKDDYTIVQKPGSAAAGTVLRTQPTGGTQLEISHGLGKRPESQLQVHVSTGQP